MKQTAYIERRIAAHDGLMLYCRDYGDPLGPLPPALCLAGLTRNSGDFHELALHLAPRRRVLAMDLRGRGRSDYDPKPENYQPGVYLLDIAAVLAATGCHRIVAIGTSLGGILSMVMGAARPSALAGVVLNDIGPEINADGIARIRGYVGKTAPPADMAEAAQTLKRLYGVAFPDFTEDDWRRQAELAFVAGPDGTPVQAYDAKIAQGMAGGEPLPDLWPPFRSLRDIPVLVFRGALSDILSVETFERMQQEMPGLTGVTVPNRGHTPTLTEPVCLEAIDAFLARIDDAGH